MSNMVVREPQNVYQMHCQMKYFLRNDIVIY